MLISNAILSRTGAMGVGFLLNSISRVASWSCVARCLLLFFCCWVRVLFRGGLLDPEVVGWELCDGEGVFPLVEAEAVTVGPTVDDEHAGAEAEGDAGPDLLAGAVVVGLREGFSTSVAIFRAARLWLSVVYQNKKTNERHEINTCFRQEVEAGSCPRRWIMTTRGGTRVLCAATSREQVLVSKRR